ncbi:uncharacterized protein DFL_005248 [Arthrobotrys flagrans]|uniref:Uncharacterized protein n=1 Tax=Arthrobotrys flagrans TaxID=97331 RepID=A0A437A7A2_ARTFL|nr:hypothetical protein DFL_005248 [Arthrobotrys flagrans]
MSAFNQEQHTLNHLFGVHTESALKWKPTPGALAEFDFSEHFRAQHDVETAREITHQIETHEPLICLTLSVPIEVFRSLIERKRSEIGAPHFHLSISHGCKHQSFGALRRRIGQLDPPVVLNLDGVNIEKGSPILIEDPDGWQGKSDVIFSCMIQTWIALLQDCKVSLEFTPGGHLPENLPVKIFESKVHNHDNVRLSTKFPLSTSIGRHLSAEKGLPSREIKLSSAAPDGIEEPNA